MYFRMVLQHRRVGNVFSDGSEPVTVEAAGLHKKLFLVDAKIVLHVPGGRKYTALIGVPLPAPAMLFVSGRYMHPSQRLPLV